jgi:hypothetical protein
LNASSTSTEDRGPCPFECPTALERVHNPYFIGDEPALTQASGWVDAWTCESSAYAVAAERTIDVAATVNFAARTTCGWSSKAADMATTRRDHQIRTHACVTPKTLTASACANQLFYSPCSRGYIFPLICLGSGTLCLDLGDFGVERFVVFPSGHLVLGLLGPGQQPLNKAYRSDHRDTVTNPCCSASLL